jgi:hypothetical protein
VVSRTHTIGRLRLLSQKLAGALPATPEQAVRSLLAMQAQDLDSVLWSIGVRTQGATVADVGQAMTAGTIARSWPLRGTLHVTCAEDLPWLLQAFGPRIVTTTAARRAELGLDERTLKHARDIAQRRLAGGRAFTRQQLLAAFTAAGIAVDSQRGYHLLFNLSLTGTLCSGPPTATDPTFVLLSEWVKKPRRLERDQALGELARRYVEGHGPATLDDLVGWAKLTASDAKRGVEVAGRALTSIESEGVRYLSRSSSAPRGRIVG